MVSIFTILVMTWVWVFPLSSLPDQARLKVAEFASLFAGEVVTLELAILRTKTKSC